MKDLVPNGVEVSQAMEDPALITVEASPDAKYPILTTLETSPEVRDPILKTLEVPILTIGNVCTMVEDPTHNAVEV